MNNTKRSSFIPAFLLIAGSLFLYGCSESPVGEETPSALEQALDGSQGEPVEITVGKAASVMIDFNDLGSGEFVAPGRYAALGVSEVKTGPGGSAGIVVGARGIGPCDGTQVITTAPFTGPSILFNFASPVSMVSIEAGDFGPSDSDVMTMTAYSAVNAGGAVVGSDMKTLPLNHPTGCLGLSVAAGGIRSVEITSTSFFPPNESFPNSIFLDNLDFDAVIEVDIDIKPGSFPNSINTKSKGNIPVAVLGSASFDVNDIDRSTLAFGPNDAPPAHNALGHLEDVNNDGFPDLVSHYKTQDTGLAVGDTEACVTGMTTGGQAFEGCDSVNIVK